METRPVMSDKSEENRRSMLCSKCNFCCCCLSFEFALSFCHRRRLTILPDLENISLGFLFLVEVVATDSLTKAFCLLVRLCYFTLCYFTLEDSFGYRLLRRVAIVL